jgi:hypothetical protein
LVLVALKIEITKATVLKFVKKAVLLLIGSFLLMSFAFGLMVDITATDQTGGVSLPLLVLLLAFGLWFSSDALKDRDSGRVVTAVSIIVLVFWVLSSGII